LRISDWSSDVCSSDLYQHPQERSDDLAVVHCDQQQPIVGTHGAREQRGRLRRVPRQAPQTRSFVSRLGERNRSCHVRLGADAHVRLAGASAIGCELDDLRVDARPPPAVLVRCVHAIALRFLIRSEEHTSELQSLMRISYAVFCLKNKKLACTQTSETTT